MKFDKKIFLSHIYFLLFMAVVPIIVLYFFTRPGSIELYLEGLLNQALTYAVVIYWLFQGVVFGFAFPKIKEINERNENLQIGPESKEELKKDLIEVAIAFSPIWLPVLFILSIIAWKFRNTLLGIS